MTFSITGAITTSTADSVERWLSRMRGPVSVTVDSLGGDFYAGHRIYAAFKRRGNVSVRVMTVAASAGAFIALGGRHVSIYATGQMMLHGATLHTRGGNERELSDQLAQVQSANAAMTTAIIDRTRQTPDTVRRWLSHDTYFSSSQAKAAGLVDEVVAMNVPAMAACYRAWPHGHSRPTEIPYPTLAAAQIAMATAGVPLPQCRIVTPAGGGHWQTCLPPS